MTNNEVGDYLETIHHSLLASSNSIFVSLSPLLSCWTTTTSTATHHQPSIDSALHQRDPTIENNTAQSSIHRHPS
jgi:hypothetical protein